MFSHYFANMFTRDNGIMGDMGDTVTEATLGNFICTDSLVVKSVKSLRSGSSAGSDNFASYFLKNIVARLAYPLCKVFNMSLSSGEIPSEWRTAIVTPVFKKGNSQLVTNYRPISLTSCISKVLERIVRDQLYEHLMENDLIPKKQHGFVNNRSRVTVSYAVCI